MTRPLSVVKLGGSLVADGPRLRGLLRGLAEGAEGAAVIVPGGGGLAEAVREAQAALGFDDGLAHRLALDAMGGMARILQALEPRLAVSRDPAAALARGLVPVWDPAALKAGHPAIPESWDVTSDSLALFLAAELGAARCILVKSARAEDPVAAGLVDAAFPRFARRFRGEIRLRGPGGERVWRAPAPAEA
ncbi:aspartate/glutamate/uridylate kinase [Methylobacterium sp. 4-46]|uniref:uridylate kinase n=1 Tax=unclassified Methylobacterium TaxID=2615210 RepID=UPI000152D58D|nr:MULTISPECIES: uridylate kinase [Methylobacterium]ACA19343.1 aspartate/glutamate/uridylate kinase [Methylobacterium sp. 4-46]WFT78542.1 uridylate kinase [Methylobacterium nodulans]